jgi:hypothetical protein
VRTLRSSLSGFTLILPRYVANLAVFRQLHKQVNEENALQKSIIIMQQNSAHFEEGIVRAIQSAWQTFDEWQSRMSATVQDTWRLLGSHMASIPPDHEWISFSARSDHLLDPDTPLRNPEAISYPSKEDPSLAAVHTGYLERKKRFTRAYRESYFVLTPSGFLHEYSSSDPAQAITPLFSLFLPLCTLGPASSSSAKSHKFHIEGRKDGAGTIKTGSLRIGRRSQHAWSFRARSHEDMMEWWNDIRMLCARYLVASDSLERSGPIAAAVRAAGYLSEEEEGEEEEGSSVEEEQHEADDEEDTLPPGAFHDVDDDDTEPPSYRGHSHGYELGYLVSHCVLPLPLFNCTSLTPTYLPTYLLNRTIKKHGAHPRLRVAHPRPAARANASRKRRLRGAHRMRSSTERQFRLPMRKRRRTVRVP